MYAVIESGGKQYRVELGSEIQVDRLEVQPGDSITLDRVLLVADDEQAAIGRPFVDGAIVNADVLEQARGDKVVVFKYRPKARRRVKKGFRASLTTLRISDIAYGGVSAAKDAAKDERKRRQAEQEAEQAAAERAAADQALAAKLATQESPPEEKAAPKRTRPVRSTAAAGDASAEAEAPADAEAPAEAEAPEAERTADAPGVAEAEGSADAAAPTGSGAPSESDGAGTTLETPDSGETATTTNDKDG
jgi:large subunit ribosomal protein L21